MVSSQLDIQQLDDLVESKVSSRRYQHSLSVAAYAADLARRWGMDADKAYLAGLLHDLFHGTDDQTMLAEAQRLQVIPDEIELEVPMLLHGPVAAAYLKQDLGITDRDVLEAIRVHTLAQVGMCPLAQIIYIADKVEPTRPPWAGQREIRRLAMGDLDQAMAMALQESISYVEDSGQLPHPNSRLALEALKDKIRSNMSRRTHMTQSLSAQELLQKCVELAAEKKGQNIVSICLTGLTVISDYFLIVTATNARQAQTLSDHLQEQLKEIGEPPLRIEGYRDARWILLDMGHVVVHIFQEEERHFYDLERLWGDGERVEY